MSYIPSKLYFPNKNVTSQYISKLLSQPIPLIERTKVELSKEQRWNLSTSDFLRLQHLRNRFFGRTTTLQETYNSIRNEQDPADRVLLELSAERLSRELTEIESEIGGLLRDSASTTTGSIDSLLSVPSSQGAYPRYIPGQYTSGAQEAPRPVVPSSSISAPLSQSEANEDTFTVDEPGANFDITNSANNLIDSLLDCQSRVNDSQSGFNPIDRQVLVKILNSIACAMWENPQQPQNTMNLERVDEIIQPEKVSLLPFMQLMHMARLSTTTEEFCFATPFYRDIFTRDALIEKLMNTTTREADRIHACLAMQRIGFLFHSALACDTVAINALKDNLEKFSDTVTCHAALTLGKFPSRQASDALAGLRKHATERVRLCAVAALEELYRQGCEYAYGCLDKFLTDASSSVKEIAKLAMLHRRNDILRLR